MESRVLHPRHDESNLKNLYILIKISKFIQKCEYTSQFDFIYLERNEPSAYNNLVAVGVSGTGSPLYLRNKIKNVNLDLHVVATRITQRFK